MRRVLGKELQIGDVIEIWSPRMRDTIIGLEAYAGSLESLFNQHGGARIAELALLKPGLTVVGHDLFNLIVRPGETINENTRRSLKGPARPRNQR